MGNKIQFNAKIDEDVVKDFTDVLSEYKKATGVAPVKQDSIETAIKDYTLKLKKQIEILKENPTD